MKDFMNNNDLHDVDTISAKFTWCNNKRGSARILERLDRCLLNSKALELINIPSVRHLEIIASDHSPIVLKLFHQQFQNSRIRKFEDVWLSYPAATSVVRKSWAKPVKGDHMEVVNRKMSRVLKALYFWSKAKHQKLEELKETLIKEIKELQQEEAFELLFLDSKSLLFKYKVKEFDFTLSRLNTWWKQRAKAKWMKEGDVSSSFFRAFANGRRNGDSIKQLMNEEGELTEDPACMRIFYQFFCKKWEYRDSDLSNWPFNGKVLKNEDCKMLEADFTIEEVEKVIEELGNNFSPGLV
ncbi:uncharacterized protein LOC110115634 [Dendrobium catenatum]|uniref:uncharacterized protein LOC110115634 n=1 Tax=Dendrobium catenatum TaxID=906689 RepID=UPI0009F7319F|nr:uncharacterized protein LOC110115634 [Dendrobium catenatum]